MLSSEMLGVKFHNIFPLADDFLLVYVIKSTLEWDWESKRENQKVSYKIPENLCFSNKGCLFNIGLIF